MTVGKLQLEVALLHKCNYPGNRRFAGLTQSLSKCREAIVLASVPNSRVVHGATAPGGIVSYGMGLIYATKPLEVDKAHYCKNYAKQAELTVFFLRFFLR